MTSFQGPRLGTAFNSPDELMGPQKESFSTSYGINLQLHMNLDLESLPNERKRSRKSNPQRGSHPTSNLP